jgi:hypothetical protein
MDSATRREMVFTTGTFGLAMWFAGCLTRKDELQTPTKATMLTELYELL